MRPSGGLEEVYRIGAKEARQFGGRHLLVESLWAAIVQVDDAVVFRTLQSQDIDRNQFRDRMREEAQAKARILKTVTSSDVKISQGCFHLLKGARRRANDCGRSNPTAGDLLEELILNMDSEIEEIVGKLGSSREKMTDAYIAVAGGFATEAVPAGDVQIAPALRDLGKNYRELAQQQKLNPLIGRHREMLQVIQVLGRKEKNNPVLVGEPGVGKTAIVEGLALKSLEDSAPEVIRGKTIIELSMSALVAGTRYRGDFEERLQQVIAEAQADENIILFLDEIHTLVGAGSSGDSLDAANILKPALARGRLRLIGATTREEYQRFVEADSALERRFQKVVVDEPDPAEALEILEGLRETYERFHNVVFADGALQAAVDLTVRYVPERRLPDKARDVIDQAAAEARIRTLTLSAEGTSDAIAIGSDEIAATVAAWTGIPVEKISQSNRQRLKQLGQRLRQRVKAQDGVIDAVTQAVQMAYLHLSDPRKPHGVFLFAGPTGVGKTELAKALTEQIFGNESAMLRVDMSEYMEPHSVARLIGSPPGYVGHKETTSLIDRVRNKPFSLVLLDEIEKAHPQVLNLFLQVFDDGQLTDGKGKTGDFRNTIIIMTTNLGASAAADDERGEFGFTSKSDGARQQHAISEAVVEHFPPEFLGRLTGTYIFQPLSRSALRQIAEKYVQRLKDRVAAHGVHLDLTDDVYDLLIDTTLQQQLGARPLERKVDNALVAPIARLLLDLPSANQPRSLAVIVDDGQIDFVWDESATDTWN